MISSIAHRPVYTPSQQRPGGQSKALPQSSVRFGHGPGHVHADGQTCSDKNCTEGQKGERQSRLQQFFDWVKEVFGKIKDFFSGLFGKSKPQASTAAAASTPAATTTPATEEQAKTQTPQGHHHEREGHHQHSADSKCCDGKQNRGHK